MKMMKSLAAVAAGALLFSIQPPADDLTRPIPLDDEPSPAMKKALNDWIDVDYSNVEIDAVFRDLSRRFGVPIEFDDATLVAAKIERDHPITFKATKTKLPTVLDAILSPHGLTAYDDADGFRVVERESQRRKNVIRFHPIADLILHSEGGWIDPGGVQIIQIIQDTVDRDVWEPNGGDATIQFYRTSISIIVNVPKDTQEKVHRLLGILRKTRDRSRELLARHDMPTLEQALLDADRVAVPPLGLFQPPAYPPAASVIATVDQVRQLNESLNDARSKLDRLTAEIEAMRKAAEVTKPPADSRQPLPPQSSSKRKKTPGTSDGDPDL
jgi:hypothetical protein